VVGVTNTDATRNIAAHFYSHFLFFPFLEGELGKESLNPQMSMDYGIRGGSCDQEGVYCDQVQDFRSFSCMETYAYPFLLLFAYFACVANFHCSTWFSCPPGVSSLLQKTFVRVPRFLGADEIAARCYKNMQHYSSDTRTC
jgi:hypothetical protein